MIAAHKRVSDVHLIVDHGKCLRIDVVFEHALYVWLKLVGRCIFCKFHKADVSVVANPVVSAVIRENAYRGKTEINGVCDCGV